MVIILVLIVQPLNFKDPLNFKSDIIKTKEPRTSQSEDHKFIYGHRFHTYYDSLDPAHSFFLDLFDQCLETLFFYNLTNTGAPLISRLATGYHWINNMTLEVDLRENIIFHDGTEFNSSAVVWNFKRLYNLIDNHSSPHKYNFRINADPFRHLDYVDLSWVPEEEFVDIVNKTVDVSRYKVRFELNIPYSPFVHLLASPGTYILSPTAHEGDYDRIIDFDSDTLIGTGPFRFISHNLIDIPPIHRETKLVRNDNYWRYDPNINEYKPAYITDLTFIAYDNQEELDNAIKNGEVDYAEEPSRDLIWDPELNPNMEMIVGEWPASTYDYLGLSCINLNLTIRKAIAYAFDYSYVIDELYDGYAYRSRGPIPKGIKYYNESIPTAGLDPENDILTARQALLNDPYYKPKCIDRGLDEFSTDEEWKAVAESEHPIESVNYTYNYGNEIRRGIYPMLYNNLSLIGIKLIEVAESWGIFLDKLQNEHHKLETFYVGWIPDFLDPSHYIISLFSNTSSWNSAGYNNESTQDWMYSAVTATNMLEIQDYYNKIQYQLQMETHPWAFVCQPVNLNAINSSWTGMPTGTYDRRPYFYYAYEKSSGWVPGEDIYAYIEMDTRTGTDILVTDLISDISLEFSQVDVGGTTTVSISEIKPEPPKGFNVTETYYDFTTTVDYTGNIIIGMPYDDTKFTDEEKQVCVMHYDEDSKKWKAAHRVGIDTVNNIIYVRVQSLSIFVIMKLNYISADIIFDPDTLNLKSKGRWITVYIELFEGFDVNNIDITTILLNEVLSAETSPIEINDYDGDGISDLMVKFDRASLYSLLTVGDAIEVVVSGNLVDGNYFYGTDIISVIDQGMDHNDNDNPSSIQIPNLLSPAVISMLIISVIIVSFLNKKLKFIIGNKGFSLII